MTPKKHKTHFWNDPKKRSLIIQTSILLAALILLWFFVSNTAHNLKRQGIASGFDFLSSTAGFSVVQSLIDYSESSSYGRAFWVGLLNTLLVSGLGIIAATIIGFIVGISRLSNNWLLSKVSSIYIETIRNIPLLLQIFFWYFVIIHLFPHPRESYSFLDIIFVNNRGIYFPKFDFTSFSFDIPHLAGFNFKGGFSLIPELTALLTALSCYTGAFIAEIVRSGILSVPKGQVEAAYSLGLKPSLTMRLVIIPQALRVIIPPLTSQYLNLTKNSSLAAAIGYPDLVAVFAGTVLNQTGQAVEVIVITMSVYLILSLAISIFMNGYNKRIALMERK